MSDPLSLIGEPGDITATCSALRAGRITWPEARADILDYPFEPDYGEPGPFYGTWDEVRLCHQQGLLTDEEMDDLPMPSYLLDEPFNYAS
jgi:hypothetical protein